MRLDYPVDRKHSRVPVLFDQRKRDKSPQCSRESVRLTLANGITEEEVKPFPHPLKWIARIAERPAVQRGIGAAYLPKD